MSAAITIFLPRPIRRGFLLFRRNDWSAKQLNSAIAAAGFDLQLDEFDPASHVGHLPCTVEGNECGFEYYPDSIEAYLEAVEDLREEEGDEFPYSEEDLSTVRRHRSAVQLVIHYRPREYSAAAATAACLAKMTGGVVLDEPVWKWYRGAAAIAWGRNVFDGKT
jgi:hypothetical protein